jgi:hypothetical protein
MTMPVLHSFNDCSQWLEKAHKRQTPSNAVVCSQAGTLPTKYSKLRLALRPAQATEQNYKAILHGSSWLEGILPIVLVPRQSVRRCILCTVALLCEGSRYSISANDVNVGIILDFSQLTHIYIAQSHSSPSWSPSQLSVPLACSSCCWAQDLDSCKSPAIPTEPKDHARGTSHSPHAWRARTCMHAV